MVSRTSSTSSAKSLSSSVRRIQRRPSRTPHRAALTRTRMAMVFQNVSWKRSVRKRCSTGPKRIASPSYGLNDRGSIFPIEFLADAVDVYLDHIGGSFPVGLPQVLAQHLARDDLAGVAQEQFEDTELGRRQVDLDVALLHAPRGQVEMDVTSRLHGGRPIDRPPA